jgi:ATP-dependent protease ClpP protease subunit
LDDLSRLISPQIRLYGSVDETMFGDFLRQLDAALKGEDPVILELTTSGGEADMGRRIALQIRLCRQYLKREMIFVGTTTVYSAGVTIMAAFPNTHRYLARDTALLIHGRRTEKEELQGGPLLAVLQVARSKVAELEKGIQLEQQGFSELIAGSDVSGEEIHRCAETNWYLTADEALKRRLVAGLI